MDQQVKIRGYRIEIEEIEHRLLQHPQIKEAVVTVRQDKSGQYLCAYIVKQGEVNDYREHLTQWLPDYMIPSYIVPIESIPLTPSGKADRRALPEPVIKAPGTYAAPRNEIETQLREIWSEVLVQDGRIGIDDSFFALGGHSLKAAAMAAQVQKKLGVKLALADIFKTPTIRQLAKIVTFAEKEILIPIKAVESKEYYPLSFNQKRLWVIHQLAPHSTSYHIPGAVSLKGTVNIEALKKTLAMICQRHESLRTGFKTVDGDPVQFIQPPGSSELPFRVIELPDHDENQPDTAAAAEEITRTPFDMQAPPLFRSALLTQGGHTHTLIYCMHHIITDGWSMYLLQDEILRLYDDYPGNKEPGPQPFRLQYKDFAAWQNRQAQDPQLKEKSVRYWKTILESDLPRLRFPGFNSGPPDDKRGAVYRCVLDNRTKERLQQMASDNNTTLSMVLFSIYNLLLAFLSGQDEIVTVMIEAGRPHMALYDIIGYFVDSVIVKNRVDLEEGFERLLANVGSGMLEALKHRDYPLEAALDDMNLEYPDVTAAFNMFNMQDLSADRELDSLEPYHSQNRLDVKFDLILFLSEYKNCIEMNWEYRQSLASPQTIEDIAGKFQASAIEICADTD